MIDKWLLFGAGKTLLSTIIYLKELNQNVSLFCANRHLSSRMDNSTFKEILDQHNIEYFVVNDINNCSEIDQLMNDENKIIGISISAPWIFKKDLIESFKGNLYNSHGAKLPKDRGGGGLSWRIMNNNKLGYSVIHKIDIGIDTGNIILYNEYLFPNHCKVPADYEKYALNENIQLFRLFIDRKISNLQCDNISQPPYLSTYFPRLNSETHGYINWNWSGKDIHSFICAFDNPYCGASSFINNKKIRLKNSTFITEDGVFHPFQQGLIYRINSTSVFIACFDGSIILENILDDEDNDVLKNIKLGDRIYTPIEYLDAAMISRVNYNADGIINKNERKL